MSTLKSLEDIKNDNIDKTTIIDILKIGDNISYQTNPCKHDCQLLMQDGSRITKLLNMDEIYDICSHLNIDPQIKLRGHIYVYDYALIYPSLVPCAMCHVLCAHVPYATNIDT